MTKIGDLLGNVADQIAQNTIAIGDIHKIPLDESNGITPKDGKLTREKYFVVLGFDSSGNIIGGLVINTNINYNLPTSVTDYQLQVTASQLSFLHHKSFVNCSRLIVARRDKFTSDSYMGTIEDKELLDLIIGTVKESPTVSKKLLKKFDII